MSGHSKGSTIKRKKGATDAARGRLFTRLIREISVAARNGGGNPEGNPRLRIAVQNAKQANMPAENIKRAIQKGTGELPGTSFEEITYEGFAAGGVAVLVEVMTDNSNRAVSELRHILSRYHGNLGQAGSVAWMFDRKGTFTVAAGGENSALSEDDLLGIIVEAGADDMQTEHEIHTITTSPQAFENVKKALEEKKVVVEDASLQMVPQNLVKVTGKEAEQVLKLMESLEEHDDVQNVYANFDIDEKELESFGG